MASTTCFGQKEDRLIRTFNKNAASFMEIKFGKPLLDYFVIDSSKQTSVYYSFDNKNHIEEEHELKGRSIGFDADYYVLEIDGNVHLIQIQYQDIDTIQSHYLIDRISALLLPVHFKNSTELFYFEDEFCAALCWIKYDPDKMKVILQLSDLYYCERIEF